SVPPPGSAPVAPGQPPAPGRTPAPPPVAPVPHAPPRPPPASPTQPGGSGRSLEDELKSQFDPTLRELEKGLRRPKSSP
ncbi:MAG: formate-dependent phosphoribosylglycinamide formyltransferase, partial [Candidatus Contendobacter sp.]|nr:formate-dependent phosphoribosylglycinamide formyltransferase [Candidatus Contendobacter sp.]